MFGSAARTRYATPGARYHNVDVTTRIEGASPHRLVAMLYEELLTRLAMLKSSLASGDIARRTDSQTRVLAIFTALETGLDHDKGGEVAAMLSKVYGEGRRLVGVAVRDNSALPVDECRKLVAEIATAWDAIR